MKSLNVAVALLSVATILVSNTARAEYLPADETAASRVDAFAQILELLESEQFTPNRVDLRAASADPVNELVKIATGRHTLGLRGRAVQSLALFTNDLRAVEAIDALKDSTKPTDKLLPSIIVAWAQIHGESVTEELVQLAQHPVVEIRVAAVMGLGRFGGQTGYDSLGSLVGLEKNPTVRERIEAYIR